MAHSKKGDAGVSDLANVQTRTRELGCLKNNTNSVEAIVTRMQTSFFLSLVVEYVCVCACECEWVRPIMICERL